MKRNLFKNVEPQAIVPGVYTWENCLDVPNGIVDIMNTEVDDWKNSITKADVKNNDSLKSVYGANGPIRFDPEVNFHREESKTFLKQVQRNALDKAADYMTIYPDVEMEVNWMETWQYITYKPPKHMTFHSDNHAVRDPRTNKHHIAPYLRRFTILTYLNDDFDGGSLVFRYFPEVAPYKPPAGSVVIMPSAYVWSHATTPLLNGRKAAFLVSMSSHYDVGSEETGAPVTALAKRELR
jgi:mRNA-degrading endonuclease HigB of HigAB toxin-antitoxin module|tara:strand:+ start:153 stop:866 length:714 start_codon:yes stop_codon:yes gene_type:complete